MATFIGGGDAQIDIGAVNDGGTSLTVDGRAYRSVVTITRPSNTANFTGAFS